MMNNAAMKLSTPRRFCVGLLACAVLLGAATVHASADIRTERVVLQPGTRSAVVTARIKGRETVDYVLAVQAGQAMNISMATRHGATYFNILAPGESEVALFNGSMRLNQYEGVAQASGDYKIRVYMMRSAARRNEVADYRLEMVFGGKPASAEKPHGGTPGHPSRP